MVVSLQLGVLSEKAADRDAKQQRYATKKFLTLFIALLLWAGLL